MLCASSNFAKPSVKNDAVAVSKLGKMDLVLVQLGAKINSLLLWELTRTRFTAGTSPYLERLRVPAGRSAYTPHCHLLAFQCAWVDWTRKLAAEQCGSKFRVLFGVGSIVADGVSSQNFRHWSAEASSDRLLDSAKPWTHWTERLISCQKDWR